MLFRLLSLFPIDAADARRAADTISATPFGPAVAWVATFGAGLFAILAVADIIGGAA